MSTALNIGVVGLGKMGLSHLALFNAHPGVRVTGVCDATAYTLGVLAKYTKAPTYDDYGTMLSEAELDAVVIATPSDSHAEIAEAAMERGLHVFCEKPLTLNHDDTEHLVGLAEQRGLITQVGYHNRFLATFAEARRLLEANAIGKVTHILGEAYGPVVLKPKGSTWRSSNRKGGGCLYDYAAHVINLLNWYVGEPMGVGGTVLTKIMSREVEDAVFSTLYFPGGVTGQISVNWSDASHRKMTTTTTIRGTGGRITVDRQECRVYLSSADIALDGYKQGWNVRYTTDLTRPVWFYLRGEEYSAQVEAFVDRVTGARVSDINDFSSAAVTDASIAMVSAGAATDPVGLAGAHPNGSSHGKFARWRSRRTGR